MGGRMVTDKINYGLIPYDKPTQGCKRLGKGTTDQIYLIGQSKNGGGSSSAIPDNSNSMGVVQVDTRSKFIGQFDNLRNIGKHSRHGEYTVRDRKSTRLNSSHVAISYAALCLNKLRQTL